MPPSSLKTNQNQQHRCLSLYSDKLWQIKLHYRHTKAAPQKILSKSTGQFCFSLPDFCIMNILDRKCRCVHPRFARTPPAEVALTHNRKRNGSTSVREPHEVSTLLTKQQEQKKDDLLFLTVQFSSCGKKERGNFSFERTLIHKSGSRHFPLAHSQE